ncbi:MAG: prephenate dehydrogenase [Corynebacterium sp.]|nr:prephenate dehydrogenase [Corynebacterium sp.]
MNVQEVQRPICIIGLGLIGGSLLRDLGAAKHPAFGYNRSTSGARSAAKEGFDVSNNLPETLQRAQEENALIVIAVPMEAVGDVLDAIAEHAPTCGMTDVVSVKSQVLQLVKDRGMESRYVGSHPMAGTAHSGWSASHTGLFRRAAWAIAYDYAVDNPEPGKFWVELFSDVTRMIQLVGAEAIPVRVAHHDATVARVSHLPHILAETLAVVGDNGGILAQSLAAGSFKDGTRVAATAPELVRQMCETNAAALVDALDEALDILTQARDALAGNPPDISTLADSGYRARTRLEARSGAHKDSVSPVRISSRPVLRLQPGAYGWVSTLKQTESIGGRIEIF